MRFEPAGACTLPALTASLKSLTWRNPKNSRSEYRASISLTTHSNACAAFFGSVMIGVSRCGMPA